MSTRRAPVLVLGLVLVAARAAAQGDAHPPGCLALAGNVSRELTERPIGLKPGAGRLHQPVTTRSPEAQAYYDQGIAYLASYDWIDAARSFNQALRLDPRLAMAELGLARAFLGAEAMEDTNGHLTKAEALAAAGEVSEKEAFWIRLGRQQFEAIQAPEAEQAERLQSYRAALDALVALDPSDAHAWVLRGNAEEPGVWGRGQAGGIGSIAFYEAALRRDDKHLGAHHFLAHSYENVGQYATAAQYARLYAAEAPGVGHAQHMLGHVLPRLGKWTEARDQFLEADALERAYMREEHVAPEEDWHHGHNLHLLAAVYLHLGENEKAERAFREAYDLQERGPLAGAYGGPYVQYLLLRGRNQEALDAALELQKRPSDVAALVGGALAGEALLGLGRTEEARRQLAATTELKAKVEAKLADTRYARFLPVVSAQYVEILRGRLLLRSDHPEEGDAVMLAIADEVGGNPRLDAWASGVLRVDRGIADAERLGRKDLAAQMKERTKSIR